MNIFKQGLSLALLGAGLSAIPGMQAVAAGQTPSVAGESLVQQMRGAAKGAVKVTVESATGKIGFVRAAGNGDLMPGTEGNSLKGAVAKSSAYLKDYAPAFGATSAQLEQSAVSTSKFGWTVTYVQNYKGVPVFGSQLKANLDRAGDLTSVNGYAAPGLNLSVTPRISQADAGARAIATVRATPPGQATTDVSGIKAASTDLTIYRMGAIKGDPGAAVLTYVVEVSNGHNIRDMVFVDATTGKVVNRYSMIDNAIDRTLYEADTNRNLTQVWTEGDALPGGLNTDQESIVRSAGDSYWFYKNTFGRDSYDAQGAKMITVNNDPAISCPNANWNGSTTNYCNGVSSDDVVSHEWGHAYTEYTSGLIYQWQPGALNEAYSDIWGETVDLINNRLDEGEGDITTPRPVGACSTHSPAKPLLSINAPSSIAKDCLTGGLLGPGIDTPVTGDVVAPTDGVADGGTATDGCTTYDNPAAAFGKIVLVDRGLCPFVQKAQVAKDMGAAAVIIGNRDEAPVGFSSNDTTLPVTVSIGLTDRESIRTALAANETVNVTIKDASGNRVDSYRWLMGEKSSAFGGAIRDMWNPTCHGDAGKVSDAEYHCSTDDSGGVHSNSGVANHTYALLVDGGTYNDVSVTGLGFDKAANIMFRAQSAYMNPTTDFPAWSDALAAACVSLTGADINKVSTVANATPVLADKITATDCLSIAQVSAATELTKEPVQCNFQPMLAKNTPPACGSDFTTTTVWKEDFEKGLENWTQGETLFFPLGHGYPWLATTDVPGDHSSTVAYAPDPQGGSCAGDADDISSANTITSGGINLPKGKSQRLTFEHYMASESGYDGGNVKISVQGGDFKVIPASAYVFNAPNGTLTTLAAGNTNPLEGQEGFTGTDGGVVNGSWGTSIVDLGAAGAKPGDKVEFRFDMGRDGCNGNDGWYLDNVEVLVCEKAKKAGHKPVAGDHRRATAQR